MLRLKAVQTSVCKITDGAVFEAGLFVQIEALKRNERRFWDHVSIPKIVAACGLLQKGVNGVKGRTHSACGNDQQRSAVLFAGDDGKFVAVFLHAGIGKAVVGTAKTNCVGILGKSVDQFGCFTCDLLIKASQFFRGGRKSMDG